MLRDDKKPDNFDGTAATMARAGADAVEAGKRLFEGKVEIGGVHRSYPYVIDGGGHPVLLDTVVSDAKDEHDRAHPDRSGIYQLDDLASVVAWARLYTGPNTAAFIGAPGKGRAGHVVVVIDGDPKDGPDGGRRALRAQLSLSLHDRMVAWRRLEHEAMAVDAFSDFIQRAATELGNAELITMINNVEVHEESSWKRTFDEATGRTKLLAENTSQTSKVPSAFTFSVPVFDFDDEANAQTFNARLTVKIVKNKPVFTYEITDYNSRLTEALRAVGAELGGVVPHVYAGSPPPSR